MIRFDSVISEEQLAFYLSRAISYCDAQATETFEDDLRLIAELQPRFIGRSAFPWEPTAWTPVDDAGKSGAEFEELQFTRGKHLTDRIHEVVPDAMCQAVIWEGIYPSINKIPIPEWVFTNLGLAPEKRCFQYDNMFGSDYESLYRWDRFGEGCQVFDITYPESQLWLYYRACRYIDANFEAIHMGQPHLYAAKDYQYEILDTIFRHIREYARQNARRGLVLLDAHTHGIVRDGRLLFDFHAKPISARAWREYPERIILHLKGVSLGGITPSGWQCNSLPFLIEIDNWGGYSLDPSEWDDVGKRVSHGRWGWDDISWFAHQGQEERAHFLQYAHRWTQLKGSICYSQMPVRRTLDNAAIEMTGYDGDCRRIDKYHANKPSSSAPYGFGDEEVISYIWKQPDPEWLQDWYQNLEVYPQAINQDIAEPLVLVGDIQGILGGIPNDSFCPHSRMVHVWDDVFEYAMVVPWAGRYTFSISVGGTMTDVTRQGGFRGGEHYVIETTQDNERIRLRYMHWKRELVIVNSDGQSVLKS